MECAARRQELIQSRSDDPSFVSLACSHRVLRAQLYQNPKALQHFRLFALCTAGRDTGSFHFEKKALTQHLRFYLQLLTDILGPDAHIRVTLEIISQDPKLLGVVTNILEDLNKEFPKTKIDYEDGKPQKTRYYQQFRFHIHAGRKGDWVELVDGGDTDWTRSLLNNEKERLLTSAIGSERVCEILREK